MSLAPRIVSGTSTLLRLESFLDGFECPDIGVMEDVAVEVVVLISVVEIIKLVGIAPLEMFDEVRSLAIDSYIATFESGAKTAGTGRERVKEDATGVHAASPNTVGGRSL